MKNPLPSRTFCAAAWVNLATDPDGRCKLCCAAEEAGTLRKPSGANYFIQREDIEDIFNSPHLLEIRRKMLAGEVVPECRYCNDLDAKSAPALRDAYNEWWWDDYLSGVTEAAKDSGNMMMDPPISLELRLGNICNLKCHSCWSLSSKKIHAERSQALSDPNLPGFLYRSWKWEVSEASRSDLDWYEKETYQTNFEKLIRDLKKVYFTGGEPTLIPNNFKMLQKVLDQGHADCAVKLTTNLTGIQDEHLTILRQFENLEIVCSLDGFEKANEYLRAPSRWEQVIGTLEKFLEFPHVTASSVIQASNVFSVTRLVDWIYSQPKFRDLRMHAVFLENPDYFQMAILPQELKDQAHTFAQEVLRKDLPESAREFLRQLSEQLTRPEPPNAGRLREQFKSYVRYMDQTRATRFSEAFPELTVL